MLKIICSCLILTCIHAIFIEKPYALRGSISFASSSFGLPYLTPRCVPGDIVVADPIDACSKLENQDYKNKIVLVKRGVCTFTQKAKRVQEANSIGMLVWNNISDEFHHMADDGSGKGLRIYSALIHHPEAEKIYNFIVTNTSSVRAYLGYCPFLYFNYYS